MLLKEKGVHIVTVNDYLAKRDSEWMGKIYNRLGLKTLDASQMIWMMLQRKKLWVRYNIRNK